MRISSSKFLILLLTLSVAAVLCKHRDIKQTASTMTTRHKHQAAALLNSMIAKLEASQQQLAECVINASDGSRSINVSSLLANARALPVVIEFLEENGYSLNRIHEHSRRTKRDLVTSIGDFLYGLFSPIATTFQENLQASFQSLLSNSINDILELATSSLFSGKPLDLNSLIGQFIENLKESIKQTIVYSVRDTLQQQALAILDVQINLLNGLLESLKGNSIGLNQFMSDLQGVLTALQTQLRVFIPSVSDIIAQQLDYLISQIIGASPQPITTKLVTA
jgi:hypothetical protein